MCFGEIVKKTHRAFFIFFLFHVFLLKIPNTIPTFLEIRWKIFIRTFFNFRSFFNFYIFSLWFFDFLFTFLNLTFSQSFFLGVQISRCSFYTSPRSTNHFIWVTLSSFGARLFAVLVKFLSSTPFGFSPFFCVLPTKIIAIYMTRSLTFAWTTVTIYTLAFFTDHRIIITLEM